MKLRSHTTGMRVSDASSIFNAHPATVRTPQRIVRPNNPWNEEPVVWYESPFGESEWLPRSTAEQLFKVEHSRWEQLGAVGRPPRIVDRAEHIREMFEVVREIVEHRAAPRSARDVRDGVTRCQRCGRVLAHDGKPHFKQPNTCRSVALLPMKERV